MKELNLATYICLKSTVETPEQCLLTLIFVDFKQLFARWIVREPFLSRNISKYSAEAYL